MKQGQQDRKHAKLLLMGKSRVGKTSMRSIIFANQAPKETFSLGYTSEVAETRSKFMGNLSISILDCGGQEEFIKQYFETKREQIFSQVEVLIFVIEAENFKNHKDTENIEDITYFENCIKALSEFSPEAKVFVLVHKMDLVFEGNKTQVFEKRKKQLEERCGQFKIQVFATSIWEITLYRAWTEIVSSLVQHMDSLKESLKVFANACGAEEVILFEKNTFLLTCHYSVKESSDEQRFEKISHIIKKFKLSCLATHSKLKSMSIQTKNFITYLDEFTKATYIMIIMNEKKSNLELLRLNVNLTRKSFEEKISNGIN